MKRQIGLLALMAVLMMGLVYGLACTFDQEGTYLKGATQNISVTVTDAAEGQNATIAIVSAGATGCTISGTLIYNGTLSGVTANESYMNTTIDTLAMRDDTACEFTMTLKNGTDEITLATCTGTFYADNTVPVCSFDSALVSRGSYVPEQEWIIDGTNASSGKIRFGSNRWWDMTETSDIFSFDDGTPEGIYTVQATASDGLNTTACANLDYVNIDSENTIKQVGGALAISGAKAGAAGDNSLAILVIIGAAAFWYVKKKK